MRTLTIELKECRECPYRKIGKSQPYCVKTQQDIPVYEYSTWLDRDTFPEFCPAVKDASK